MKKEEIKRKAPEFFKQYYQKTGEIPSIAKTVEKLDTNNVQLYAVFPGGQREICRLAGIPLDVPMPQGVPTTPHPAVAPTSSVPIIPTEIIPKYPPNTNVRDVPNLGFRIVLTENQSMSVRALGFIEGISDPSVVMDNLLVSEGLRRKQFPTLSFENLARTYKFLMGARARGWTDDELLKFLTESYNLKLDRLSPQQANSLIVFVKEVNYRKWSIANFLYNATRAENIVGIYTDYRRGNISSEEAIRNIRVMLNS